MSSIYRPFYEGQRVMFTPVDKKARTGVVVVNGVVIPGFLREGYAFNGSQRTYFEPAKQAT